MISDEELADLERAHAPGNVTPSCSPQFLRLLSAYRELKAENEAIAEHARNIQAEANGREHELTKANERFINMSVALESELAQLELWQAMLIVGTINDHWWMGSQVDEELGRSTFSPDECGPCGAIRDMPAEIRREAVRLYLEHTGGTSTYWDAKRNDFRNAVDFSKAADIESLVAEETAEETSSS